MTTVIVTKIGRTIKPKAFMGELIQEELTHITIEVHDSAGKRKIKRLSKRNSSIRYLT